MQALLDLGLMAISALGGRRPTRYSEVGGILMELGIVDSEAAELVKGVAGLRDILVHAYTAVDRSRVADFAVRLVVDAPGIAERVVEAIRSSSIDPLDELPEAVKSIIVRLSEVLKGRVRAAFLFGGFVKGYSVKGDYDLAVLISRDCSLLELGLIQVDVAEALGVGEDLVDLLCLNWAPPKLILEDLEGLPIVVEDPVEILELKVRSVVELIDIEEGLSRIR
ncbi:MAG: HepT-like ribonuclease domain-containing protein [Candidatus Bathyarchaeia archaeon]